MSKSLLPILVFLGLTTFAEAADKLTTKVYPVADLMVSSDAEVKAPCRGAITEGKVEVRNESEKANNLINMITNGVQPKSWGDHGGPATIDYFPLGMALVVRQSAAGHEEIAVLLTLLRKLQDTEIAFEMRVVTVPENLFEQIRADFDIPANANDKLVLFNEAKLQELLEAIQADRRTNVMQTPKLTAMNGQTATVEIMSPLPRATDLKPVSGSIIYTPAPMEGALNSRFDVQGVASADHKTVGVRIKAEVTRPEPPACYDVPRTEKLSAARFARIPNKSTMLIPVGKVMSEVRTEFGPPVLSKIPYIQRLFKNVGYGKEAQVVLLFVTPRIIEAAEERPQACPSKGGFIGGAASVLRGGLTLPSGHYSEHLPQYYPEEPDFPLMNHDPVYAAEACGAVKTKNASPYGLPTSRLASPMGLGDIVQLTLGGISDELIVNQIRTTGAIFVLNTQDIILLKSNKVSDRVVLEMQNRRPTPPTPREVPVVIYTPAPPPQPATMPYYYPTRTGTIEP